jgi:hypothetical protein
VCSRNIFTNWYQEVNKIIAINYILHYSPRGVYFCTINWYFSIVSFRGRPTFNHYSRFLIRRRPIGRTAAFSGV